MSEPLPNTNGPHLKNPDSVGDAEVYRALMGFYMQQDTLSWSRTQALGVVEIGLLTASFSKGGWGAVATLLIDRRGQLFLQKRSRFKDCFPRTWDSSAAGHVAPGETYDECAVREVKGELGWTLEGPPERLFKIDACAATGQEFVWVYQCRAEGPSVLPPGEIEQGGWFTSEQISAWLAEHPRDFAGAVPLIWTRWRALSGIASPPA